MPKQFMPDVSPEERLQMLKDHCESMEETKYYRDLTADELDVKRETFVDNAIKLSVLNDELQAYKDSYKNQMKPYAAENAALQMQIKTRKQNIEGTLFHIADQSAGIMETYDEFGEFVSSRRLRPDEKQTKIFSLPKASNQ